MIKSLAVAAGFASVLACQTACAQGVTDPTRPAVAPEAAPGAGGGGTGLQSVLISDNRKAAVIGGQVVELGHKYGDATLTRVSESEVTLSRGRETQILRLFPGVEKRMVAVDAEQSVPAQARKKTKSRRPK
jgi:MSHA biogenesis protein MshK